MEEGLISMSKKELTRLQVVERLIQKQIKQSTAAELLGVNVRTINRLKRAYKQEGANALISKLQGISDIVSANDFLPQFMKEFNQKFAVTPRSG